MNGTVGPKKSPVSSCYVKDALAKGAERFNWAERIKRSGQQKGSKVTGIGVGQAYHPAGFANFDGLCRITPDGRLHIHTGVGNLGTFSHTGTARIAAEVLKYDWEKCEVVRGDTRKNLLWNIGQFGSNTSFTMSRTNYVAAADALQKLKEIAAKDLGGKPDDYDIDGNRVFAKNAPGRGMTYAKAAQRAIEIGGKYSGKELPQGINPMTQASVTALAGSGLIGVANDKLPMGEIARVRRVLHRDRAGPGDRPASHRRRAEHRRLRHRDPSDGPRNAAQGRDGPGHQRRDARRNDLRPAERHSRRRRVSTRRVPPTLSRCAPTDAGGLGGQARAAEPAGHEGHRRAAARLGRDGDALRDFRRAQRARLQSHAGEGAT